MNTYLVATIKPWNIAAFERHRAAFPGHWQLVTKPEELTPERVEDLAPRYIFFPHWSWRVPAAILDAAECVCFHMTDVPYGRGGSPLQNLIASGHEATTVSALRMVEELDAGPVYLKRPLSLEGRAQIIYERLADMVFEMMLEIVTSEPHPQPQKGPVTVFSRRSPEESVLPPEGNLQRVYDHIRMLDAETYPRAYLEHGSFYLEFSNPINTGDSVEATVTIKQRVPK